MDTVGRYEILHELGRGGMATVYLARQPDLGRLVALKELGVLRAADAGLTHRFLREARMASALNHPNIVTVHDYFEHGGTPYIAMEYVDGGSLRSHVEAHRSLAQVGGALDGLLAGLAHAERHGIVHRDLKPENVLVTQDGSVKITDFGIAKASDGVLTAAALTATGTTLGTPAYMAPEQALGEPVTARTDLYAVGIIAYELLIGRAPFADTEAPMGVLMRQVNDTIPPVDSVRPDIDPRISAWIDGLLVKEPAARTASAEVARDGLDETLLALLGPRWTREAALPPLDVPYAGSVAELRTPSTRRLSAAMPLMAEPFVAERTLAPRPPSATMRAAPPLGAAAAAAPPARRTGRRWPRAAIALFVIVAVVAALAAAAGRATHSSGTATPGGTSATPASSATGSPQDASAGSGTSSGQTAPAQNSAPAGTPTQSSPSSSATPTQSTPSSSASPTNTAPPATAAPQNPASGGGENADDGGDSGGTTGGGTGENADDGGDGP
jgi:serine/threonine protein kinase